MVPEGWKPLQIGDLAKFTSGGTPSKQKPEYWGGSEPWISGKDLKTHYLINSIDTLSSEGFQVSKKAPKDSSLILVRGMTLLKDFPVGYATREVAFNQDLKALLPISNVDGLFLSFLLVAEKHKILQLVSTAGHGTGRLDTQSIQEHPVNLPPLPEQKKIAQILSTWDKAITTTEQLLANSQQQKKALMQQLLTGKKRLLDKNGERFEGEWKHHLLGEVVEITTSTSKSAFVSEYGHNFIIDMGAVSREGKLIPSKRTTLESDFLEIGQLVMPKDDIGGGNIIGRVGLILEANKYVLADHVYALKVLKNDSVFISYLINSHKVNKSLRRRANGTAQLGLGKKDVQKQVVHMPVSVAEQQKIAAVLSNADQEITSLQQKLDALKQEKKALMQQLLTGKRRVLVS